MSWPPVLAVAALLLVALIAARRRARRRAAPYAQAAALFTPGERAFLRALDAAIGDDYRLFGKVRVADVLVVEDGLDHGARRTAFNRISAKHFDYVLCAREDLAVRLVIELNDRSHQQRQRSERDRFLAAACRNAGLPLLFFAAQHAYSVPEVRARLAEALAGSNARRAAPEAAVEETPACPRCAGPMVRRVARSGDKAGHAFWGCASFPDCRGVVAA